MANAFENPEKIARVAAALVGQDLGLAGLVHRDLAAEFAAGATGGTVKVRVPGAVASQTRGIYDTTTPLVNGSIDEKTVDVTLSDHVYDSVALSEGDLSLELDDFAARVLVPQASAIVKHIERAVVAEMQATPENTSIVYDALAPQKTFTQMRRTLRNAGVGTEAPLLAAVGPKVYADLLDAEALDENGKVRGFEVVESTRLADDEIIGFIKEAFALVVRAPIAPEGAPYSASVTEGGFSLRHLLAFDASVAVDRSIVSAFVGVQSMPLAVDTETGSVNLVPHGGAVRVVTSA